MSKKQCVFVIVILPLLIIPAFVILRLADRKLDDDVFLLPAPKMAPLIQPATVREVTKLNGTMLFLMKQLTHDHTIPHFDTLKIYSCGKYCEKRRNGL